MFTLECSEASDIFRMADSGLVVVVTVITLLLVAVFIPLISVQYEWCQVLFENNTVSENEKYVLTCSRWSIGTSL